MNFFRKTLEFTESRINKGNYREAIEILDNHINSEHTLQSDLFLLKKAIDQYTQCIANAKNSLELISKDSTMNTGYRKQQEITAIREIEDAKAKLDKIKDIINALKKDRIRLE